MANVPLRQNGAVKVLCGPFLDKTDGVTAETGLTLGGMTCATLVKANSSTAVDVSSDTWTEIANGYYTITLTSTDQNTVGPATLYFRLDSTFLPVRVDCTVYPAQVYDSIIGGTDLLQVDVTQISGDSTAADNCEADYDGTGYNKSASTIGTCTTNTDLVSAASIADAVWDEAKAGHVGAGSFGEEVQAHALSSEISALNDLSAAEVNAEVDTALSDIGLDHLLAASVAGSDVTDDSIVAMLVSKSATADWDDYVNTTDSLQALRDRGDAAWITGAGGTNPVVLEDTTVGTVNTQTNFTIAAGSDVDDAYNGQALILYDASNSDYPSVHTVSDYVGSTKTVTIDSTPNFTITTSDGVKIMFAPEATVSGTVDANVTQISGDSTAADNLEAILDGTGGVTLTLKRIYVTNPAGTAVEVESTGGNGVGLAVTGHGSSPGAYLIGGATGNGLKCLGNGGAADADFDLAGTVNANITQISGDSGAADNLEADYDGTGYNRSASTIGTVTSITNSVTVGAMNSNVLTASAIASAAANYVADHVLRRNTSNVEASSDGDTLDDRSLYGAIAGATHKSDTSSGSTEDVYKSNDSTLLVQRAITTDAAAEPIVTIDPP